MSNFISGFEKNAGLAPISKSPILRGAAYSGRKLRSAAKELLSIPEHPIGEAAVALTEGARAAAKGVHREIGKSYGAAKLRKMQRLAKEEGGKLSKEQLATRAAKLKEHQALDVLRRHGKIEKANKPSWAMRHPLLTAGGGALAGKYLLGGEQKQEAPPQVIYPQTGY